MMCSLKIVLLCTPFFLCLSVEGRLNYISLPLYKPNNPKSLATFISNVNAYEATLAFFLEPERDVAIAKVDQNIDYLGNMLLGSPEPQRFTVTLDTSFSGLWVISSSCIFSFSCWRKNYYNHQSSQDYVQDVLQNKPQERTLHFGQYEQSSLRLTESTVNGELGYETLWLEGTEAYGTHFMEATDVSDGVVLFDGVLGLGFPQATLKMTPPFFTMLDRGILDRPEFSLFVGRETGELTFGGRALHRFQNETLQFHPLNSSEQWQIEVDSISINGNDLCPYMCKALIDTGTALIVAPYYSLVAIYKAIGIDYNGEVAQVKCSESWMFPSIKIAINGQVLVLKGRDYTIEIDKNTCVLGIMSWKQNSYWIFGNVFLSTVYTIFNIAEMQIGFALLSDV